MQAFLFLTALAAASAVDCRKRTIPDFLCLLTAAAGLISFSPAQFFGVLAALPLLIAALIRPECMGGGDIKLTAAAGFVLGFWRGIWGMALGLLLAVLYFCTAMLFQKFIHHPLPAMTRRPLPLGPFFIHRLCRTILFWRLTAMKKFHVTRKTVLTIVGVTLPLTAAAIPSAPVEAEQKGQIGPGVMPGLSDPT